MDKDLKKNIILSTMKIQYIDGQAPTLHSIHDYMQKISLFEISKAELAKVLSNFIKEDLLNINDDDFNVYYIPSLKSSLQYLDDFTNEFGYNFSTDVKYKNNPTLQKVKKNVLLKIFERAHLRDKECFFKHIGIQVARRYENSEQDFTLIRIALLALALENKITIRENKAKSKLNFSLNPYIIPKAREEFHKEILDSYFSLSSTQQEFLNHSCLLTKKQNLKELLLGNSEAQEKIDDINALIKSGFMMKIKGYRKNDEILFTQPLVLPTYTGSYVVDYINKHSISDSKSIEEDSIDNN